MDQADRLRPGVSPLDGPLACPRQRKLAEGELLPYHKRDWPGLGDRDAHPDGYQQSDSFPVSSSLGPAVVQTYDFGDEPRRFGRFDAGDGGQVAFFTAGSASFGITEDGGAGLQFFLGPGCAPTDGWVTADNSFPARSSGAMLARITRRADRCPDRLGYAFTRWSVQPISFRDKVGGRVGQVTLTTLVSEHFGGRDADLAANLERMYFTRELGYTRWERWQNLSRNDRAADRREAAAISGSGRCERQLGSPSAASEWVMTDCREWTQIVGPADPAGDRATFWIERLRGYPSTGGMFAPG